MKHYKSFNLFFGLLVLLTGCAEFSVKENRSPSSIQNSVFEIKKFKIFLEARDASQGLGLKNADLFVAEQASPVVISEQKQVLPNARVISLGRTLIDGTPTRIYLDKKGEIAFIAFDDQAVRILSYESKHVIDGHGIEKHGLGYSTALGQPQNIKTPLSELNLETLRKEIGSEGQEVELDYASGIKIHGVIEKYVGETPLLVTFKTGTCKVTYGVHTLFEPAQGEFNLLLDSEIKDSNFKN